MASPPVIPKALLDQLYQLLGEAPDDSSLTQHTKVPLLEPQVPQQLCDPELSSTSSCVSTVPPSSIMSGSQQPTAAVCGNCGNGESESPNPVQQDALEQMGSIVPQPLCGATSIKVERPPPCGHNNWDNLRAKNSIVTLCCRDCQQKWKQVFPIPDLCPEFHQNASCTFGPHCPMLHVHRFKSVLKSPSPVGYVPGTLRDRLFAQCAREVLEKHPPRTMPRDVVSEVTALYQSVRERLSQERSAAPLPSVPVLPPPTTAPLKQDRVAVVPVVPPQWQVPRVPPKRATAFNGNQQSVFIPATQPTYVIGAVDMFDHMQMQSKQQYVVVHNPPTRHVYEASPPAYTMMPQQDVGQVFVIQAPMGVNTFSQPRMAQPCFVVSQTVPSGAQILPYPLAPSYGEPKY